MYIKIKDIIDATESLWAKEYLDSVVLNLSKVIDMEYLFVARINTQKDISTTISVAHDGKLVDNFEYFLKDTPCDEVANNSICSYLDDVSKIFSKDKLLEDMNIKSYIGSPLYDSKKNVIGIFVALSTSAIEDSDSVLSIFKFFSGRLSVELDRMDKEEQLIKLNESLEEKVKYATMDLQRAQQLSNIGSWRYDILSDVFTCSEQIYIVLGINKVDNTISSLYDLIKITRNISDKKEIEKLYNEYMIDSNQHKFVLEIDVDGAKRYIEKRYETVYENDKPIILNGTIQDVTEDMLRQQHLIQQSRMAQMGEMVSMIAHQWRQPLGAISSLTIDLSMKLQLEAFDLKEDSGVKDCKKYFLDAFERIDSMVHNLTTTIDDFRTFYKPNKEASKVKFSDIIEKSLGIIKASLISDNVEVIKSYDSCNIEVSIYANELIQVILNILKNAQDNFKERDINKPKIYIDCICDSNNEITINIADNGGGIDKDVLPKIFDPYFSTKSEKNGTGLGLYMSKLIVEDHHNGKLDVKNTSDGVCFSINVRCKG